MPHRVTPKDSLERQELPLFWGKIQVGDWNNIIDPIDNNNDNIME